MDIRPQKTSTPLEIMLCSLPSTGIKNIRRKAQNVSLSFSHVSTALMMLLILTLLLLHILWIYLTPQTSSPLSMHPNSNDTSLTTPLCSPVMNYHILAQSSPLTV